MAGRAQAPHGAEHAEPVPTQAHWPQVRQPAPNDYAPAPADHHAQHQPQQPGQGYSLPHEIQAPLPPQHRHDWSNGSGFERDLRAFGQIGREQQPAEPAYAQHQPHAQGQYQAQAEQWHGQNGAQAYPGQQPQSYPVHHAGYQDQQAYDQHGHAHAHDPRFAQWPDQQPAHAGEPYNLDHYAQQQGQAGYPAQPHAEHSQGASEHPEMEEYEDESERRRGPRAVVVIAALVGALAIGGGLAYGYRMLGGGGKAKDGKPPVVKADTAPAKVKPADSGGKDVAHTDKKFLNRLTEDGKAAAAAVAPAAPAPASGAPAASSPPNEPEAPRKVTTLVVNRDGTLTPQAAPTPPGMVLDSGPRAPLRGAANDTPPQAPAAAATRVADLPLPRVKPEPPQAAAIAFPAPAEPKAAEPKATIAKKKPAPRDDAASPQAAAPQATAAVPAPTQAKATVSSGGGAVLGFVPVLTSKKSREEALKSFADLHQKYPDILGSKSPDVVQADIPEKGTFYRLIVGPPASREASRELCNKLDAQGYKGCWITAYRQ